MADIYTIGYTSYEITNFIDVLKAFGIKLVVDVRSLPYSEYYPDYNKESLEKTLSRYNIFYRNYSREFGARQTAKNFFAPEGYLDFEKFTKSNNFMQGFSKLVKSLEQGYTFALLCAEKNPATCHRSIMVSRVFSESGCIVRHILQNGETETQSDVENQLVEHYFPNRNQLTLFDDNVIDDSLFVKKAYRLRNSEIGYRLEAVAN
ncbi:hypothetical protein AGMMS50276_30380 [Synergistales bacterium]|nr:hypothetical protein AGMMS50276_30380 [Synergistales bacterium]